MQIATIVDFMVTNNFKEEEVQLSKGINVLSLFDGLGGARIALDRLGIPMAKYYASEIDKHAIKVAKHNWEDIQHIGDVTKVSFNSGYLITENGSFYIGKIDLLTGGSPCFVAGTTVDTQEGYKSIEDIVPGDYVLTHTNQYKKVLKVGGKLSSATLALKAQGIVPTTTTTEHPYYVRSKVKGVLTQPYWKEAGKLTKGDYIGININQEYSNPLELTEDECLLIGRYIADGHTRKDYRKTENRPNDRHWQLIISVGKDKVESFSSKYKLNHSFYPHSQSVYRAVFSSKRLVEIVEKYCGCGSHNKMFHKLLLDLPVHLLSKVLEGYMDGDGSSKDSRFQATTVSKLLAISLAKAVNKVYGVGASINFFERPKTYTIEGRIVNQSDTYTVRFNKERPTQAQYHVIDGVVWHPVRKVEVLADIKEVFNLEVEDDNSYTANSAIVHNCQDFSTAKAFGQHGVTPQGLEGTKSGLFYHFLRIKKEIEEYNPNLIFLLENVKMKKESKKQLDDYLGVQGIYINSELVSFQKRARYYWSNLNFNVPQDKNISFQDYKESGELDKYKLNPTPSRIRMWGNGNGLNGVQSCANVTNADKVYCLTTKQDRCPNSGLVEYEDFCRFLTQTELELAQTIPPGYTNCLSYNQAAAVLGNGWTIDVICHILENIPKNLLTEDLSAPIMYSTSQVHVEEYHENLPNHLQEKQQESCNQIQ